MGLTGCAADNRGCARTGQHDGTLAVEETRLRLDGMADFVVIPARHTFMASDSAAIAYVIRFLHNGRFTPGQETRSMILRAPNGQ